jgi:NADH-quinone oxidoreductase subunit N
MTPTIPPWNTIQLVMPELMLGLAMCAVILVPFIRRGSFVLPTLAAVVGCLAALVSVMNSIARGSESFGLILGNMLAIDHFSQFFKLILIIFTMLVILQWVVLGRRTVNRHDLPDFLCLVLGGALGMSLMASAQNLVMIFVAIEAASLPSYALAGFRKRERTGSESALKYVVFGSAASAIMLYGMSLIYGTTGALDLGVIAHQAATLGVSPLLAVGLMGLFAGLAFKLSAVPLHFWCPDVFQGAPTEVTTFLSVASKAAAVALLLRILAAFGAAAIPGEQTFIGLAVGVAILGALTATWGNLVALHQTNIKRLLAYSSIAHACYMIMTAAIIVVVGPGSPAYAIAGALLFYILVYTFMNLGAFTIAGLIANRTGSEDIRDYANLYRRSPMLAMLLTLFLLSLFGMPGLGGFIGKVLLMQVMANAGLGGFVLIAVLLINTVISLYYYLRPVYFMYFVADTRSRPAVPAHGAAYATLGLCALMLVWTGLFSDFPSSLTHDFGAMTSSLPQAAEAPVLILPEPQAAAPVPQQGL